VRNAATSSAVSFFATSLATSDMVSSGVAVIPSPSVSTLLIAATQSGYRAASS
jgi:hypothetical protein